MSYAARAAYQKNQNQSSMYAISVMTKLVIKMVKNSESGVEVTAMTQSVSYI